MNQKNRKHLFDRWARLYDWSVDSQEEFPFAGYNEVIQEIIRLAAPESNMQIMDLGTGTGNVAKGFVDRGCRVWGIDFSEEMLSRAREKVPQAHFVKADLLEDLPKELPSSFHRVVSAYVLHEFELPLKVRLINEIVKKHLYKTGYLIVGDISFPTMQQMEQAHKRYRSCWDEKEFYWIADESINTFKESGFEVKYEQVSFCGGVYVIRPIKWQEGTTEQQVVGAQ